MKYKYLILDFGNVIVRPTSDSWDITPKFLELIIHLNMNCLRGY